MTTLKRLMVTGIALAISAGVAPRADAQAGSAEIPPDVTEFVSRSANCSEWSKKEIEEWSKKAIDPAQMETINGDLQSLRCFDILDDARALQLKYAGNPEILASLRVGHSFTKLVIRLPVRIAVPPASDR